MTFDEAKHSRRAAGPGRGQFTSARNSEATEILDGRHDVNEAEVVSAFMQQYTREAQLFTRASQHGYEARHLLTDVNADCIAALAAASAPTAHSILFHRNHDHSFVTFRGVTGASGAIALEPDVRRDIESWAARMEHRPDRAWFHEPHGGAAAHIDVGEYVNASQHHIGDTPASIRRRHGESTSRLTRDIERGREAEHALAMLSAECVASLTSRVAPNARRVHLHVTYDEDGDSTVTFGGITDGANRGIAVGDHYAAAIESWTEHIGSHPNHAWYREDRSSGLAHIDIAEYRMMHEKTS